MNLIKKITEIRKEKGMSQAELAKAAGLSTTYISFIESGKKSPTLKSLEKISQALNIPFPILSFLALDENDVHPDKRAAFELVRPAVKAMVNLYVVLFMNKNDLISFLYEINSCHFALGMRVYFVLSFQRLALIIIRSQTGSFSCEYKSLSSGIWEARVCLKNA